MNNKKYCILQHWNGPTNKLVDLSIQNIAGYAEWCGADYQFIIGKPFDDILSSALQKLIILDERFDEYDVCVMLDTDVFVCKNNKRNIFLHEEGIGRHTEVQDRLVKKLVREHPEMGNLDAPYWGGSIYRLDLKLRRKLRAHLNKQEYRPISRPYHYEDEGAMHRMASLSGLIASDTSLYLSKYWNYSSFEKDVHKAHTIHMRTKIAPKGPKRTKLANYQDLVQRGLI